MTICWHSERCNLASGDETQTRAVLVNKFVQTSRKSTCQEQLKQRNLTSANQAIKPAKLDHDSKSQQSFGGFNRDAIRSQDQKRVEKYVKNQEKIKNDNPIMKFVNY